jgi:hypothetical protein
MSGFLKELVNKSKKKLTDRLEEREEEVTNEMKETKEGVTAKIKNNTNTIGEAKKDETVDGDGDAQISKDTVENENENENENAQINEDAQISKDAEEIVSNYNNLNDNIAFENFKKYISFLKIMIEYTNKNVPKYAKEFSKRNYEFIKEFLDEEVFGIPSQNNKDFETIFVNIITKQSNSTHSNSTHSNSTHSNSTHSNPTKSNAGGSNCEKIDQSLYSNNINDINSYKQNYDCISEEFLTEIINKTFVEKKKEIQDDLKKNINNLKNYTCEKIIGKGLTEKNKYEKNTNVYLFKTFFLEAIKLKEIMQEKPDDLENKSEYKKSIDKLKFELNRYADMTKIQISSKEIINGGDGGKTTRIKILNLPKLPKLPNIDTSKITEAIKEIKVPKISSFFNCDYRPSIDADRISSNPYSNDDIHKLFLKQTFPFIVEKDPYEKEIEKFTYLTISEFTTEYMDKIETIIRTQDNLISVYMFLMYIHYDINYENGIIIKKNENNDILKLVNESIQSILNKIIIDIKNRLNTSPFDKKNIEKNLNKCDNKCSKELDKNDKIARIRSCIQRKIMSYYTEYFIVSIPYIQAYFQLKFIQSLHDFFDGKFKEDNFLKILIEKIERIEKEMPNVFEEPSTGGSQNRKYTKRKKQQRKTTRKTTLVKRGLSRKKRKLRTIKNKI